MIEQDFKLVHIIITQWHRDNFDGVNNILDMIDNKDGNIYFTININIFCFCLKI